MALTFSPAPWGAVDVWGRTEVRFYNAVPAASDYVTGGYAITAGSGVSLGTIWAVVPLRGQAGYVPVWNSATGKLQIWVTGTASGAELNEVANGSDLSALTFTLLILGN